MAWKGLHLSQPAKLELANGQLVVIQKDDTVRLPLEDIAYVIIDTPQATLTSALLSACVAQGIALIHTDARHTPNGVTLSFHTHHRQASVAALQMDTSQPLRKRLWQSIIVSKITNQATVLQRSGRDNADALVAMARLVGSGDPDNVEARAARDYWRRLFSDFIREDDADFRNKCLNYGYAVVRACIARAIVAVGLLPSLGLHHASASNAFNLADDLVEPLRPIVDLHVWTMAEKGSAKDNDLSREDRQSLAGLPMTDLRMGDSSVSLLVATEMMAEGLVRAFESGSTAPLILPRLAAGR